MMRLGLVSVLCLCCFLAGYLLGAITGNINTETDFCYDETSSRYITDDAVRESACSETARHEEN